MLTNQDYSDPTPSRWRHACNIAGAKKELLTGLRLQHFHTVKKAV